MLAARSRRLTLVVCAVSLLALVLPIAPASAQVPLPPPPPVHGVSDLNQYRADAATAIAVGGTNPDTSVVFKGVVSSLAGGNVSLQIEVQPVGTGFTNAPSAPDSAFVPSGSTASTTKTGLTPGTSYHWQARMRAPDGLTSSWVSFGSNAESAADFTMGGVVGPGPNCGPPPAQPCPSPTASPTGSPASPPAAPPFSRPIAEETPLDSCLQGQFETRTTGAAESAAQNWYIRSDDLGILGLQVHAVSVNGAETGAINARLYNGATLVASTPPVAHPTGAGSEGTSNQHNLVVPVTSGTIYRLEVTRSGPTGTGPEAHHYRLVFDGIIDVGLNSETFSHFEHGEHNYYVNVGAGEALSLDVRPTQPQPFPGEPAPTIDYEVRSSGGSLLTSGSVTSSFGTITNISMPAAAAADTLGVHLAVSSHYRLNKLSGTDKGIYMESCLKRHEEPVSDRDGDDVPDADDNCPDAPNGDQADTDADGQGDACDNDADNDGWVDDQDNCPTTPNGPFPDGQANNDGDARGDPCDHDDDNDGVADGDDNCQFVANDNQQDDDHDGIGDACDDFVDNDGDGYSNAGDNCPNTPNGPYPDGQEDRDNDDVGDACDDDRDGDHILNNSDNCPDESNGGQENNDGDAAGDACDADDDNDGDLDDADNCPFVANADQANEDGDGQGDACDDDRDGDGVDNGADNCPGRPNADQADLDGDQLGDACDTDRDGDGVENPVDNCANTPNEDQANQDGDSDGDACDGDLDDDGVANATDNCPRRANSDQADGDGDGQGDVCDGDRDGDGVDNGPDNCPDTANRDQEDADGDQVGDLCDSDRDGDFVIDSGDNCPGTANADQADRDGDGVGDACDTSLAGRMTGGGSVFTGTGVRVTHGFELHCDLSTPNRLQINWGRGSRFHLTSLTEAFCGDNPAFAPAPPPASGFDTFAGSGVGSYNGAPATVSFVFTDAGEPGTADTAAIEVRDANGAVLVVSGSLSHGNHQAH